MKRCLSLLKLSVGILLILMLSFSITANAVNEKIELSEQGYEDLIPNFDGSLIIAKLNNKYGLIDAQGNVLVDFLYTGYVYGPNAEGYTIFYIDAENSFEGIYYNENLEAKYVRDSFLFDRNGALIYSMPGTNFASVNNNILEIRYNYEVGDNLIYSVKYVNIFDLTKTVAEYDSVIASTAFSEAYAAVETVTIKEDAEYNDLYFDRDESRLHIIDILGKETINNTFPELIGAKTYNNYPLTFEGITIAEAAVDGTAVLLSARVGYFSHRIAFYDFEKGKLYPIDNITSAGAFITDDFYKMSCNNIFAHRQYRGSNYTDDTVETKQRLYDYTQQKFLTNSYNDISRQWGKYILVQKYDGRWGYIDTTGREYAFFKDAADFVNGKALVMDDQNRVYVINENFEQISDYYDQADSVCLNYVRKNGLCYLVKNFADLGQKVISVMIDGEAVVFDQPPVLKNDRTLVPVRAIFEKLGAVVSWDEATQTVSAVKGDITVTLQIDNNIMYKNGEAISLDVPAQLIGDRTLVPVRAVSEAFNCKVDWDAETQTVLISGAGK